MNSDHLGEVMSRATENLQSPTDRLITGAIERAGQLRRRGRITRGVAAGSAACAIGAAALFAPTVVPIHRSDSSRQVTVDAAGVGQTGRRVAPLPAAPPPGSQHYEGVPADAMAQMLAKMVVPGATTSLRNWSGTDFQAGSLVYDDGHGKSLVTVLVEKVTSRPVCARAPKSRSHPLSHVPKKPNAADVTCAPETKAEKAKARANKPTSHQGTLSVQTNSPEYPGSNPGGVVSNIVSWSIDGYHVEVDAYNAPAEKGAATTRQHPALSISQLTTIAKAPAWRP